MIRIEARYRPMFAILIVTMSFFQACMNESQEAVESETSTNAHLISLSKEQFANANMKLGKVQQKAFYKGVKSYGMIDVPPENRASVSAYFGGYVKRLGLLEGQRVKKGEVLFTLENPSYVEIQQEYLEAKGQLDYLKSDYERQKNLAAENVSSQKKYLKAEADYKVTLARYESLKKKLRLMNINPESLEPGSIQSQIKLTAPLSGIVTQVNATGGMYLNPDDIALTIIDPSHIHLDLHVFEKDLPKIKKDQAISFSLQNDPGHEYEAYVHLVGNYIDPVKRSASIHGHLKHEDESTSFIPGMYIEAEIKTGNHQVVAIQSSAIVKDEGKYFVLVKVGEEEDEILFEKRELIIGENQNGFTFIKNEADLAEHEEVLIEGAFNLIGTGEEGGHEH